MANWVAKVKIKHLLDEKEDLQSVRNNMNAIADALSASGLFTDFDIDGLRNIPEGDGTFAPVDYANRKLDRMYDYADYHRIWIC